MDYKTPTTTKNGEEFGCRRRQLRRSSRERQTSELLTRKKCIRNYKIISAAALLSLSCSYYFCSFPSHQLFATPSRRPSSSLSLSRHSMENKKNRMHATASPLSHFSFEVKMTDCSSVHLHHVVRRCPATFCSVIVSRVAFVHVKRIEEFVN